VFLQNGYLYAAVFSVPFGGQIQISIHDSAAKLGFYYFASTAVTEPVEVTDVIAPLTSTGSVTGKSG